MILYIILLRFTRSHSMRGKRHKTVECPSVRLSVCPVDRQQQRRPTGLLLRSGAGSRHRSIAAAAARHAGRVNFGPTARRCTSFTLTDDERFLSRLKRFR